MKKIKIIPKNKKDKIKAKILESLMEDFTKSPEFLNDIMDLSVKLVIFNSKWGTDLNLNITNLCEKQR